MRRLRAGLVTPLPGGLGTRPGGTTAALQGACWTGTGFTSLVPGSADPRPKIAAVERREARLRRHGGDAPRQACRAASPAAQGACAKPPRFSALRSLKGAQDGRRPTRGRKEYGRWRLSWREPGKPGTRGVGYLKIKSVRRGRSHMLAAVDVDLGAVHVRTRFRAQHVNDLGHLIGRP